MHYPCYSTRYRVSPKVYLHAIYTVYRVCSKMYALLLLLFFGCFFFPRLRDLLWDPRLIQVDTFYFYTEHERFQRNNCGMLSMLLGNMYSFVTPGLIPFDLLVFGTVFIGYEYFYLDPNITGHQLRLSDFFSLASKLMHTLSRFNFPRGE